MKIPLLRLRAIRNMSIYTLGALMLGVVSFLLLPIYSNHIAPEEYGILNLIIITIAVATLLVDGGMNTAFSIKFYKVDPHERGNFVFTAISYNLVIHSLVLSAAIFFPNLLTTLLKATIPYTVQLKTVLIILLTVLSNAFLNLLRLQEKAGSFLVASLVRSIVMAALNILFLVALRRGYESYLDATIVALFVVFVWGAVYYFRIFSLHAMTVVKYFRILKDLVRIGWPLVPNGVLAFVISSSDKFIIDRLLDKASVGIYTMGFKFGIMIEPFLIVSMGQAFMPVSYRAYSESEDRYRSVLRNVWLFYIISAFVYLMVFMTSIDVVYRLFINKAYWMGCGISIVVSFAYFFYGSAIMLGGTIILRERTYLVPLLTMVTGAIDLGLNFILIPRFGIQGSAAALLFTHFATFVLSYVFTQRLLRVRHMWREIGKNSLLFIAAAIPILLTFSVEGLSLLRFCIRVIILVLYGFLAYRLNLRTMKDFVRAASAGTGRSTT